MTQHEKIYQYIMKFGSITPMEAFEHLHITKLATRIGEMKDKGIEFDQEKIRYKNDEGKSVSYMKYSIRGE